MTTEEKAKAYDEALEKARIYRDNAKAVEEYAAAARYENIFPELRESEDEKIMKAVVKSAEEWYKDNYGYDNPQGKAVVIDAYVAGAIDWLKKQKEQKPTATINGEPIPTENHSVDIPLAEWSEEDERMLSRCEKSIESSKQFADSDTFKKAKDNEIDWLENRFKSLRPSWKPSEEQIQALEYVVSSIPPNYLKEQKYVMTLMGRVIQQLKKLLYGSTE